MGRWSKLHTASGTGDLAKVRYFLEVCKYDVDCYDEYGEKPLHKAAYGGHFHVVRVLILEFNVDVNVHNNSGDTPLHWAAEGGPHGCGQGANIRVQGGC